jgi:hypothetical protein
MGIRDGRTSDQDISSSMNAKTAMRALRPTSGAGAPPPALLAPLRRLGRVLFYRSPRFRLALVAAGWPWLRARLPRVAHLVFYDEFAFGPVQRDEALVLHALVRDVRPRTVVEIGFQGGLSSFNFLRALEPDAMLYAFDISDFSEETARDAFAAFPNFVFRRKSQDEIEAADVDLRPIDLVFLDASHELELNARTFDRLVGLRVHELAVRTSRRVRAGPPALGADGPARPNPLAAHRTLVRAGRHAGARIGRLSARALRTVLVGAPFLIDAGWMSGPSGSCSATRRMRPVQRPRVDGVVEPRVLPPPTGPVASRLMITRRVPASRRTSAARRADSEWTGG